MPPQGRLTHYFSVGSRIPKKYKIGMGEIDLQGIKIPLFFFCAEGAIFFLPLYFAPKARKKGTFWSQKIRIWGVPPWTSENRPTRFDVRPDFGGKPPPK